MTILGTKPAQPGPARPPKGRDAERVLAAELLDAFRAAAQTSTEFMERLQGRLVNHVLAVETVEIPAEGWVARNWGAAAGAVEVTNLGAATATATVPAVTVGANPAAVAEASVTVPAGETWQLQSVDLTLVTSVTAGNRRVALVIDDGANIVAKIVAAVDQAASLTVEYVFAGAGENAAVRGGVLLEPLPAFTLGPGWRIRTITTGMQAGDDYGAPVVSYIRTTTTPGSNVTVHAAGAGAGAPTAGVGVYVVATGQTRVVAVASRQVTFYGAPGDRISYQAFTAAPHPAVI